MTDERADLGFGEALDNLEKFSPSPKKPPQTGMKQAAEAAGFERREAKLPQQGPRRRGRRTGRNVQFNLKVKPETIEEFSRIADNNGWGLGETLEQAVVLLQREYGDQN